MADNPSNIVPDNLIVIEGGKQLVPAPESSDAGKVLGVLNASGDIGWVVDQSGTFTQVQADWTEADSSKPSYVDHKPSIPSKTSDLQNDSGFITSASVPTKTSDLQNDSGFITSADIPAQAQADWNESNNQDPSFIKNKPTIPAAAPTPGNMLSVTNGTLNVTTTAGITDIQYANALPANPVATVLYLIPEA